MKKLTSAILTFLAALGLLTGCGRNDFTADNSTSENEILCFTDDLGREVNIEKADRTVAMIGSFADIWCLAGGKDSLAAAANDAWTSFDLGLDEDVINIGTSKAPSLEAIFSAEPDLVLCSTNTAADIELEKTFEEAGITAAYFDVESFDDYLRMLDICTEITGCRDRYETYGTEVEKQVEAARERADGSAPTVLYIRASGSSCTVKSSSGNLLGEMLADLGCVNVADSDKAFLENLSIEGIMKADPEYIFAVLQGADDTDARAMLESTLLSNPVWQTLTAVREGRFFVLENSLYNLKPNAKWGYAYEKLADILYG